MNSVRDTIHQSPPLEEWKSFYKKCSLSKNFLEVRAIKYWERLEETISISNDYVGLDFGCAYGHLLKYMSGDMGLVYGMDISSAMLAEARKEYGDWNNVIIQEHNSPPASLHQPRFDLITVNSCVQYFSDPELRSWLHWWIGSLSPRGYLILSDLYPKKIKHWSNFWGMITWGFRERCLAGVLWEFALLFRTGYFKIAHYGRDPEELISLIGESGGEALVLPENIDLLQTRYSLIAHCRS